MGYKLFYIVGTFIVIVLLICLQWHNASNANTIIANHPERIVSLAPGITETLYALGLGEQIVGVTRFCEWPEDAATKHKIGGYREINLEAIIRSGANLAIIPANMAHYKELIEGLGISVLLFDTQSLENFLKDVIRLGNLTGRLEQAKKLITDFAEITKKNDTFDGTPTVLMALVSPEDCQRPITELTIIGKDGFYDQLIEAAGGKNAYSGITAFPRVGLEAIIAMNPDLIIVAAPRGMRPEELKTKWGHLSNLQAIGNGNFLIFNDPGDTIPGPRSLATAKKIANGLGKITQNKPGRMADDTAFGM